MINELWAIVPGYEISIGVNSPPDQNYRMVDNIAVVPIAGPTTKYGEFGTRSTIGLRNQLTEVAHSPDVDGVMLIIDSPGGTVKGTHEAAMDVRALSQKKPTFSYASDMMGSAAYYIGSQAGHVSANESAYIGSIGTMSMLVDASEALQKQGVKPHLITSGGIKGIGTMGAAVTPEHLVYQQARVNEMSDRFVRTVAEGRNMQTESVRSLADGRLHIAADAARNGLIDSVMPLEQSIGKLQDFVQFVKGKG